jgi:hypothetical protein
VRKMGGGRQVEIDVEPPEIALLLPPALVDLIVGKDLAARRLLDMRQGQKTRRQESAIADLVRCQVREIFPGRALAKLHAHAFLNGLALSRHHGVAHWPVGQVEALFEKNALQPHHGRFLRLIGRLHVRKGSGGQWPVTAVRGQGLAEGDPARTADRNDRQERSKMAKHNHLFPRKAAAPNKRLPLPQSCLCLGRPNRRTRPMADIGLPLRAGPNCFLSLLDVGLPAI